MNNVKERNSVPTSVQESSEDPPGFIYPSYRAAGTETQRDKPSLESSTSRGCLRILLRRRICIHTFLRGYQGK